jgi:hypothetical protein
MDPILPVSTGAPLLAGSESQQDPTTLTAVGIPSHCRGSEPSQRDDVTTSGLVSEVTRRLFVSHFLSTWNSRVFEFGAVLYLANIFPQTLLPLSAYALARGASAILFSPAIGQYIDAGDRLHTVRLSIGEDLIVKIIWHHLTAFSLAACCGRSIMYCFLASCI